MKSLTKEETRNINGGFVITTGTALLFGGAALAGLLGGRDMVIAKEHRKYGHCVTYRCSDCRWKW